MKRKWEIKRGSLQEHREAKRATGCKQPQRSTGQAEGLVSDNHPDDFLPRWNGNSRRWTCGESRRIQCEWAPKRGLWTMVCKDRGWAGDEKERVKEGCN
ncbi:hypothetical protein V6N13_055639 [Hibiscus sabdariffa]|uniref:Uncharacterized protein n=1 Tax=Hibiscus sabdariffa TaxID=183260 RepID=A0ABR2BM17_9ROSI